MKTVLICDACGREVQPDAMVYLRRRFGSDRAHRNFDLCRECYERIVAACRPLPDEPGNA